MQKRDRPLLPAGPLQDDAGYPPQSREGAGPEGPPPRTKKKRFNNVRVACDHCRLKKSACNGVRPTCGRCRKNNLVCQYVTSHASETSTMARKNEIKQLRGELEDANRVLRTMRNVPEDEAVALLRQLRSASNTSHVPSSTEGPMSLLRPSDLETARSILPLTKSKMEFELTMLSKLMYPPLTPIEANSIDADNLLQLSSRGSAIRSNIALELPSDDSMSNIGLSDEQIDPALLISGTSSHGNGSSANEHATPLSDPSLPIQYCDARLCRLKASYWTKVPVSNVFAATAISFYLENEHPVLGFFDADLFLRDVVEYRLDNCSSFLFNTVLCISFQCYAALDSRASSLSLAFLSEAEKLWRGERASRSTTSLAATSLLSLSMHLQGLDSRSLEMMADVSRIGSQLNLYGVPHSDQVIEAYRQMPPESIRATAHIAWGAYCWLSIHAVFYRECPIFFPPVLPIPGKVQGEGEWNIGEQPWPAHPLPEYMGYTFPALCSYWPIAQEIYAFYFTHGDTPLQDSMPLGFAEEKYRKLLAWANTLDATKLNRGRGAFGHVWVFHSLYHATVLDLFRPFLRRNLRLRTFSSPDGTPATVFNASKRQMQRLIVEYMSSQDPKIYSLFFHVAILHVSSLTLGKSDHFSWQFYFSLCMAYWKVLFVRHPVFGKIAQANLCVGMKVGKISSAEARKLLFELQQRAKHHEISKVTTACIVDFERAMSARDEWSAQDLAQKFDELVIFGELMKVDYSQDSCGDGVEKPK